MAPFDRAARVSRVAAFAGRSGVAPRSRSSRAPRPRSGQTRCGRPRARSGPGAPGRAPRHARAAAAVGRPGRGPRIPCLDVVVAFGRTRPLAQDLAAHPAVPDRHGPAHLAADQRIVGRDDDRHAQLAVDPPEQVEDLRGAVACRARRSARRRGGRPARWPGPPRSPPVAAPRRTGAPADGRRDPPSPTWRSSSRAPGAAVGRHAVEDHRQRDVLERGQVRQQVARRLLPDEADDLAQVGVCSRDPSSDRSWPATGPPGRRRVQPAEDVEERALARPGGAHQGHELAGLDEQVEALEGDDLEVCDLVDLDQVVAHDHRPLAEPRHAAGGPRRPHRAGRRSRASARSWSPFIRRSFAHPEGADRLEAPGEPRSDRDPRSTTASTRAHRPPIAIQSNSRTTGAPGR